MKKGPLSNKEKEYIDSNLDMDVDQLAEAMDRSTKIVANYVEKVSAVAETPEPEVAVEPVAEPVVQPVQSSPVSNLMARDQQRGVVVMTEAASMESDERRKAPEPPSRYSGMIHKIKKD